MGYLLGLHMQQINLIHLCRVKVLNKKSTESVSMVWFNTTVVRKDT